MGKSDSENAYLGKSRITLGGVFRPISLAPFVIRGVAITEGIFNGMFYPGEMLKKLSRSGKGLPIRIEHGRETKWGDEKVGKVTNWEYDPIIKGIVYNAEIWDKEVIDEIKSGSLDGVSIAGMADSKIEGGKRTVTNLDLMELSLTDSPACDVAFVRFSKKFLREEKALRGEGHITEGGKEMVEEIEERDTLEQLPEETPKEDGLVGAVKERLNALIEQGEASKEDLQGLLSLVDKLGGKVENPCPEYKYEEKQSLKDLEKRLSEIQEALTRLQEGEKDQKEKYPDPEKKEDEVEVQCPACPKKFASVAEFAKHWEETHQEKYGGFKKEAALSEESKKEGDKVSEEVKTEEKQEGTPKTEETSKEEKTVLTPTKVQIVTPKVEVVGESAKEETKEETKEEEKPAEEEKKEESKEEEKPKEEGKEEAKEAPKEEETTEEAPAAEEKKEEEIPEGITAAELIVANQEDKPRHVAEGD